MQISGLSASNSFSATDVLAIEVNVNGTNKTYKLTGATLATALASIGSYLKTTDVVNNLTSTSTDKPLSAAMGKELDGGLANCITKTGVKHQRFVLTTDPDGDAVIGINITTNIVVGMYPSRTGADNTRTQWFGLIIGKQSGGSYINVKCVDDAGDLIRSAAVAIDVYWIEGITPDEAT